MPPNSVTLWLRAIEQNDESGAQKLFDRYFERLVVLARKKLQNSSRRVVDEEDIAITSFYDCLANIKDSQYPQVKDRTHLWRLLVKITECRVHDAIRRQTTTKRGSGRVRGESIFLTSAETLGTRGLAEIPDQLPSSADLTSLSDEFDSLLGILPDDNLRNVAKLVIAGFSTAEISERLNRTQRTIQRRIEMIKEIWNAEKNSIESESNENG